MLRFSILLLFALQISAVFCRSTADYNDETTDSENTAVSYSEAYEDKKELNLSNEMHNQSAVLQDTMPYDVYEMYQPHEGFISYSNQDHQGDQGKKTHMIIYICIMSGIFAIAAITTGCIFFICFHNRRIRRGIIFGSNTLQQTEDIQEQAGPTSSQYVPPTQPGYQQVPPMTQPLQHLVHVNPSSQKQPLLHAPQEGIGYSSFGENHGNPTVIEFHNPVSSPPPYENLPSH